MQKILSSEFYQGQKRCPRFSEIVVAVAVAVVRASEGCTWVVEAVRNNTEAPLPRLLDKKHPFSDSG